MQAPNAEGVTMSPFDQPHLAGASVGNNTARRLAAPIHGLTHVLIPPPGPVKAARKLDRRSIFDRRIVGDDRHVQRVVDPARGLVPVAAGQNDELESLLRTDQTHKLSFAHPFVAKVQYRRRPVCQNVDDPELHRAVQHQLDGLPVRRPHQRDLEARPEDRPQLAGNVQSTRPLRPGPAITDVTQHACSISAIVTSQARQELA